MTRYAGVDYTPLHGLANKKGFRAPQWNLRLPWWFILCGSSIVVFYSVVPAILTYLHGGQNLEWVAAKGVILGLSCLLVFVLAVVAITVARSAWVRYRTNRSAQADERSKAS
jgi:sterol desaturase/sphingolipid hydroxylase (fatty acid hydroxylase superfamily)